MSPARDEEEPMRVFAGIDDLQAAAGTDLGVSPWLEVTQERVNQFANATGDHQWLVSARGHGFR